MATKAEKIHMGKVAALGCIACSKLGYDDTPAEIHHITTGTGFGGKASNFEVIPLCPAHHRAGFKLINDVVVPIEGGAIHKGVKAWEENFGTQRELLKEVNNIILTKK